MKWNKKEKNYSYKIYKLDKQKRIIKTINIKTLNQIY